MKFKSFILSMIFTLLLTGCSLFGESTIEPSVEPALTQTPTVEPTPILTPTPEVTLTNIYLRNSSDLYVEIGKKFSTDDLVVIAKYSDDSEKDISDLVSFGSISTDTPGEKKMKITFEGLTIDAIVNVVVPSGIEVDTESVKLIYKIGEKLDLSNLRVFNLYEGEIRLNADKYSIIMKDSNNQVMNILDTFTEEGIYIISIISNGFSKSFEITVPEENAEVSIPSDFDSSNISEEKTINNVSANAIDVNVEEFIKASPKGYSLDAITIGLDGKIISEIPYEENMVSAYFTDLTVDTEYEVGAYYVQNQATTLAFRKAKDLTYRFHFVGFMIVTKGEVLYRVRMMYDGDCLYRWYFAAGTYVANQSFFYNFQLPVEYDGYTVAGCEEIIETIESDVDLDAILVPPASNTCAVIFYDRFYPGGLRNIISMQTVNKGGSATPPTIESYIEGDYLYTFREWSISYTNVTNNVYTYPLYDISPLNIPTIEMSVIIGDTYCMIYGDTSHPDLWLLCHYTLSKVDGTMITSSMTEVHPSNVNCIASNLTPNTKYQLTFYYTNQELEQIPVNANIYSYEFTTRKGTEKLGYQFTTSSTSYQIFINEVYVDIINFVEYTKDSNGKVNYYYLNNGSGNKNHNTTYYLNPVSYGDEDFSYFVYFDNITIKTKDATKPTVSNDAIILKQESFTVTATINDPSVIVKNVYIYYKLTDNNSYISKYVPIVTGTTINIDATVDLSVVDPETGITHYYEVTDVYLSISYVYSGCNNTLKQVFDLNN